MPVTGEIDEAHEGQRAAQALGVAAKLRPQHQTADLGQPFVVVPDAQNLVGEVAIQRLAVALLFEDVEEDVRRAPAAVLREDHRGPRHFAGADVGRHEDEAAVRHRQLTGERGARALDDGRQRRPIVGQVHGVQVHGRPLQIVEIFGRDVAK